MREDALAEAMASLLTNLGYSHVPEARPRAVPVTEADTDNEGPEAVDGETEAVVPEALMQVVTEEQEKTEKLLDTWFQNQVADMKITGPGNYRAIHDEYQALQNGISQGNVTFSQMYRKVYGKEYVPTPTPTPIDVFPTRGVTVIPLDTATPEPSEAASQVNEIQDPVEYVHQEFLALTADIDPDLRPNDEQLIENIEMIIDFAAQEDYQLSTDELAYVLATAQFESAMVGELAERWDCYDSSENIMPCENSSLGQQEQANYHFELLYYKNENAAESLGNKSPSDSYVFHGRGFVQLTGRANYQKFADHFLAEGIEFLDKDGEPINLDLTGSFAGDAYPHAALDPQIATYILVHGMQDGLFTTFKLSDFQTEEGFDFYNARQIVNPGDEAEKYQAVADLAVQYAASLDDLCEKGLLPEGIGCLP